ncbi:MAG: hypothetical protein MI802_02740 [Desulfobacterales bacterium]|nr:hypothetical protein [Desulfobacterales bacterium]
MEIKLDNNNIVEVKIGSHVYDELSDTWINWDMLDPATRTHLETLVKEVETSATAIRSAAINTVSILMKPALMS